MEEIYVKVEYKPVDPRTSANQTSPRSSERRFHGSVVFCLGLFYVLLLVGLIALSVYYHDSSAELSINDKLSSMTEERDLLNASLAEMTKEVDRLQRLSKQKKTCPAGWKMFSCTCYLFSTNSHSWEEGRRDCRDRGADLVIIDSSEEQEFLTKNIRKDTWIGLTDRDNEGTWKWTDETPLTLAYWVRGQPDSGGGEPQWGEEDCAILIAGKETEENWNDRRCDDTLKWICEKMA